MSVYKRGQIWWVRFQINGKEVRESAGTTKRREALEYERALRSMYDNDIHAGRMGRPVTRTYNQALTKWVESGAPESMHSHARNTTKHLGEIPLQQIVPVAHDMRDHMLTRGLSPQTINRRLAVVRRILNMAYNDWGWLREPLGQKIKLLSEKGLERHLYLSQDEVTNLVKAIDHPVAADVVMLAAYTGLRRGEVLGLTEDNWKIPYIILDAKTKGKKPRSVPVVEVLHDRVKLPFALTNWELRKAFEEARESIQRPDIRFHDLRHTFASWLASDPTVPLTVIRDVLGHSNLSVTSRYAHLRGDSLDIISTALAQKPAQENDK